LNTKEFYTEGCARLQIAGELATPFFGDARFPVAFRFVNSMKLSEFGDYEQYRALKRITGGMFQ